MRRKYIDCQRDDGNCLICSALSGGKDCHGRPITNLERYRRDTGLTQAQLAQKAGVYTRVIQKIETGEALAGNVAARNILSIADALNVEVRDLLEATD